MGHPYFDGGRPTVFGHRGASGELPENTLPAFHRAIEQGADALETDVHWTRDGQVVVCHDADVARTTDATGPVAARSYAELSALDAGYRFSTDGGETTPYRGRGFRMPLLRELFESFPDVPINVEFKVNTLALIDATLELVRAFDRADRTLFAGEHDETMGSVRARVVRAGVPVAIGASIGDVAAFVKAALSDGTPPPEPMALQIPPQFAGQPLVTPELIQFAHRHEVAVHVWTVNETPEMERLLALGVDGVMSDFPGRLRQVVDARRGV